MSSTARTRPQAQLIGLIAAATVVPLITLLWVGWRLFEQDRVLERQQVRQRVERTADHLVAALQRSIAASEQQIGAGGSQMSAAGVAVTFHDDVVDGLPPGAVAYLPRVRPLREAPAGT